VALFGLLALVVGLFVILTGCLGLCAAKFKKCCFTMPFMIFTIIMTIVVFVVFLIGYIASSQGDTLRGIVCDKPEDGSNFKGDYESLTEYMKEIYGPTVNKFMCTPSCPCDIANKDVWAEVAEADMLKDGRNRVFSWSDLTADQ